MATTILPVEVHAATRDFSSLWRQPLRRSTSRLMAASRRCSLRARTATSSVPGCSSRPAQRSTKAVSQAADGSFTPLLVACQQGHVDIAKLLRDAGASLNQATEDGATPLYIASQQGHLEAAP